MIPAKSLPIMDLLMSVLPAPLQPVAKPVVDLVSPVMKVLIDLGYDWSGDPGVERWLSPLPFNPIQNWPAVGLNLVAATIQGIQAFVADLGGLTTAITPAITAPTSDPPVSTLAAARFATPETTKTPETPETTETTETTEVLKTKQSTSKLTVVKDPDVTVEQTTVENDTTAASTDETPEAKPESTNDKKTEDKKPDDKKADDKKADDEKKADTEKKTDTDKKDADSAKSAA
jgi:hypothetical protein